MSEIYIVQGRAEQLPDLIKEARGETEDGQWCWTCPKTVERGDIMCVYLLTPVSAVVARATFTGAAFIMDDEDSDWYGKPMATYAGVSLLAEPISLLELRELFPEWHWTRRPQGSVRVPDNERQKIEEPFLELLSEREIKPQD